MIESSLADKLVAPNINLRVLVLPIDDIPPFIVVVDDKVVFEIKRLFGVFCPGLWVSMAKPIMP